MTALAAVAGYLIGSIPSATFLARLRGVTAIAALMVMAFLWSTYECQPVASSPLLNF